MKLINSIEELKAEASSYDGAWVNFFISLNFGLRSSKQISYNPYYKTFDVYNEIDDSYQEDLTEEQLSIETFIIEALNKKALFKYE